MKDNFLTLIGRTLEILECDSHSLSCLAEMSGLDRFTFYRSADLSGLDLSNQDLRGLNFDGANLRGSRLDGALYDQGAFNGSKLDAAQQGMTDHYDVYLDDVDDVGLNRLYLFVEFRGTSIEEIISAVGLSYKQVAAAAKLSSSTLRKTRQSQPVAIETARSLAGFVKHLLYDKPHRLRQDWTVIRQPIARFLVSENDGSFSQMRRNDIPEILAMSDELLRVRREVYPSTYTLESWRDKPTSIATSLKYLRPSARSVESDRSPRPPVKIPGQIEFKFRSPNRDS
ncbi:MAG TPA: pentapeptide repeat-containing protein [Allosphingosinicella sp.]|jgi:hypothetical protein